MTLPIYIVDSFTSRAFAGNPTAVCIAAEALEYDKMLNIAREMNCPVTAFLTKREKDLYDIRYFTTITEISACGHGTLGSSKIILNEFTDRPSIDFHTIDDIKIRAAISGENILMTYPVLMMEDFQVPEQLLSSLGIKSYKTHGYSPQLETLFIELDDSNLLKKIRPDFDRLRLSNDVIKEVVLTAPADESPFDYILRSFCPWIGIDEDPVTGSVHSVLGPFWSRQLKKTNMKVYQASRRGGEILVNAFDDRVEIGGNSVIILRGEIII